jgi:pimeloyl-ACP methyl ester carboxylesterase
MNTPNIPTTQLKIVEADGLKIFYREAGPTDGPVLLLLHGFPTSPTCSGI